MKRYWITPFTMGAFVLTGVTGLLMFFKVRTGLITPIHEWFSLTLVLGGVLHVIDHWTGIRRHLAGPWGKSSVTVALVLLALALEPWPAGRRGGRSNPAESILAKATVEQIAQLSGDKTESVIMRLERAGAKNVSADQSIERIANASSLPIARLIAFVHGDHGGDED